MAEEDVVLVTGFPSLLARAVCGEIVRTDSGARVVALVRPNLSAEAHASVAALREGGASRVELLEGDASAIDFGLSGRELKSLAATVTQIHHCAQITHLGVDRKTAEHVNIGATAEAIEVASCCLRLESLVFHSTAHVAGNRTGLVREDELNAGQSFRSVVEETRARAEKLMRSTMGRLPITIVRPSTIVGDSRTGEVDRFDGPYLLILLVVTTPSDIALPLPGRGDEPLNLVPIDWVAKASVALGREPRARGRTVHLVDPNPLATRRVFELVARSTGRRGPRGSIPAKLARALLRAPGLERIAHSPRALLDTLTTSVAYDARWADELLPGLGVPPCPPLEDYVDRLVDYVKERVRNRRVGKKDAGGDAEDGLT